MKRKVNIDREKISTEEIEARKNFRSLIKSYPSIANPFRRTSWRTKNILWVLLACAGLVWFVVGNNPFEGYDVYRITGPQGTVLEVENDEELREHVSKHLISSQMTDIQAHGSVFELQLTNGKDTIRVKSYSGGKLFSLDNKCYQSEENLLPDSLISRLSNN